MPILDPSCFLGLTQEQRREQMYLALGGDDDGCFIGQPYMDQLRAMQALIGFTGCLETVWDFWAGWLTLLDPTACTGLAVDGLQQAVYALLYAEAADPSLMPPNCFLGVPPEERAQLIIEIIMGGEVDPFEPSDLEGLVLRLQGEFIEASNTGDLISNWPDQTEFGWDATSVGGGRPTYTEEAVNSLPAATFGGVSTYIANIDFDGIGDATSFTLFSVFRYSGGAFGNQVIIGTGAADALTVQFLTGDLYTYDGDGTASFPYTQPDFVLYASRYDGSAVGNANRLKVWVNGIQQTLTFSGTVPAVLPSGTGFILGRYYPANALFLTGDVYSLLGYNRALLTSERQSVEEYFFKKCGLATVTTGTTGGLAYQVAVPMQTNGRGIILFHGSSLDQTAMYTDFVRRATGKFLAAGYTVVGTIGYAGGTGWGNTPEQTNYADVIAIARSSFGVGDVLLWGMSMGGVSSLLTISHAAVAGVVGWLGTYPVCNLANMYANVDYTATIEAAYGGNYALNGIGHDPMLLAGGALTPFTNLPMMSWASPGDTVVTKAANSDLFKTKLAAYTNMIVNTASGEHGDQSHIVPQAMLNFANSCF